MRPTLGDQPDLRAQLERARAALKAPPHEKVSLMLAAMPALVESLDRVQLYQTEIHDLRQDLVAAVTKFRELVRDAMRINPGEPYKNAHIGAAAKEIDHVLSRISELLGP